MIDNKEKEYITPKFVTDKDKPRRESPFKIRLANMDDLPICVELTEKIPEENDWEYFPPTSREKIEKQLSLLIDNKTLIVYENNGIIVGVLGIVIDTFWWTDEEMILDMLFYIRPEFRSYNAYKRLLSTAEEFAKINKLPLSLLFFTTKDTRRKFNMVRRRGYKPIGFWVIKK